MDNREIRIERFKQTRLETIMTNEPRCTTCPETHYNCFENHHIAGQRYHDLAARECLNCHAKLTALQKGHPPSGKGEASFEEIVGRFLMGLADFFELLITTLREFGEKLIEQARSAKHAGATASTGDTA
jgi:hypothetical protein